MSPAHITAVHPRAAIPGGRVSLDGYGFPDADASPQVIVDAQPARVVFASPNRISLIVPSELVDGGPVSLSVGGQAVDTFLNLAGPLARGLHQVDSPAIDRAGNLYLTYSGTRGQQVPISIFRVAPNGTRETFSSAIVNPTSMAFDAEGRLHVSSRFEGTVYRLAEDGSAEPFVTDLGVACGLAFAPDGSLFVGDRSGTIFVVDRAGKAKTFATLPSSVAAFHLALGPDGLYVTAPTLSPYDFVYRVSLDGAVAIHSRAFGRPQGLAFGPDGSLYVVEALAGASGLYRLSEPDTPDLVVAGAGLIGLAFEPGGAVVVCSSDTAYRLSGLS